MKKGFAILGLCWTVQANAQVNLVPNFSFEIYDTCPNLEDQIQYATGWAKYSSNSTPTNTTPDYYNTCAPDSGFGIPKSIGCFQAERRNCNAYAGVVTWSGQSNYREHIGIPLSSPLVVGQKYFISFYVVMGEDRILGYQFGMPSSNIGLRLSTVAFTPSNSTPINNFAHLYSSAILSDSVTWQRISGEILADSAYDYVILGNFFSDSNTDTLHYSCVSCLNAESYYLLDDVCVSTDSLLCNGGIDFLPCVTEIENQQENRVVSIFPNPVTDFLSVRLEINEPTQVIVYDVFGNSLFISEVEEGLMHVDFSNWPSGIYLVQILNKNALYSQQIIKP